MEGVETTSKCHICGQEFDHQDLEAHFLVCDQEHKCKICNQVFQTTNLLKNHIVIHDQGMGMKKI